MKQQTLEAQCHKEAQRQLASLLAKVQMPLLWLFVVLRLALHSSVVEAAVHSQEKLQLSMQRHMAAAPL